MAYATSILRMVTVKKGKTIYEGKGRPMSEVRRWEEERRCMKTRETMQKWLKSPNICTFNTINTTNIEWRLQDEEKWKNILGMLSYMWNLYNNKWKQK